MNLNDYLYIKRCQLFILSKYNPRTCAQHPSVPGTVHCRINKRPSSQASRILVFTSLFFLSLSSTQFLLSFPKLPNFLDKNNIQHNKCSHIFAHIIDEYLIRYFGSVCVSRAPNVCVCECLCICCVEPIFVSHRSSSRHKTFSSTFKPTLFSCV